MTAEVLAALRASHVVLCVFVELQFADDTLRFTNATYTIPWGGYDWLGAGNFSALEPVEETVEPRAAALRLRFSGLNADHLDKVVNEHYAGRPAKVWIVPMNDNERPIIDPVLAFWGRMDQPQITAGLTFDIEIALENRWADWDRPRDRRWNDADHQSRHPGDEFFKYAPAMESAEFVWGIYKGPAAPKVPSLTDYARKSGGNLLYSVNKPIINAARNLFKRLF